jgi:hypothetical protein
MTVQYGTISLLRGKIDAGRGVDKLSRPDLATAPLGTDEEAAGAPAMHKEIARHAGRNMVSSPSRVGPVLVHFLSSLLS